jgi:class 3 adenylate cyclase
MKDARGAPSLDATIEGSARGRFFLELFGNSAIFPIANILLEFFLEGGWPYFLEPDFYAITLAAVAQAAYLSRTGANGPRRLAGNLGGPALYTAIETAVEGARFFEAPHHLAYWGFAFAIGALQQGRAHAATERARAAITIAEAVVRSSILFAMYAIYEMQVDARTPGPHKPFFDDSSHTFIAWAVALLGVVAGLATVTSQRYLAVLRGLSRQLRVYSEWFFGRALLEQAVSDPSRLALTRCDRAILFMDVRGFTAWSETQPPEAVVAALGAYYVAAEAVFEDHAPIRSKFAADEVMAIFARPQVALAAAVELARAQADALRSQGLGAGIGLHWGSVVEGLMGGGALKQFDVIGDTVNTAKRIEGAAAGGEILASEAFRAAAGVESRGERRIEVKGKSAALQVHRVAS